MYSFLSWETSALVCKLPEAVSVSCSPRRTFLALRRLFCDFSIVTVIEYLLSAHYELGAMLSAFCELTLLSPTTTL